VAVAGIAVYSWYADLLRRWIDYRFLAERLRAAVYVFVAGVPWRGSIQEGAASWTMRALDWICDYQTPVPDPKHLPAIKQFTREGWVLTQKMWFEQRRHALMIKYGITIVSGIFLFAVAAVSSWFHATGSLSKFEFWWEWLPIFLGAACLSLAGYRDYRVYRPISIQYGEMAEGLTQTAADIDSAAGFEALAVVLKRALDAFASEHRSWRVLVHVHEPHESI